MIKILLSNTEIDLNVKFNYGGHSILEKTILSMAIENNNTDLITLLLSKPNIDTNVKLNNWYLSDKLWDFVLEEKTVLSKAVEDENIELIKLLLSNPNTDPNVKLFLKNAETKDILLEQSALFISVIKGQKDILNLFLNSSRTNTIQFF